MFLKFVPHPGIASAGRRAVAFAEVVNGGQDSIRSEPKDCAGAGPTSTRDAVVVAVRRPEQRAGRGCAVSAVETY